MLLTCTHTAAYGHPVAQFSIRYCICTAVIIAPKLNAEELVDRGTQRESIEDGVSLCVCGSYCCESLTLKLIVQNILYYVVFLKITIIFDCGCVISLG